MRNPRVLALSLLALLALAAIPAAADAVSGDPPIEPLSPANGSAVTITAGESGTSGIHLTFKCPVYHLEEPETQAARDESNKKAEEQGKQPNTSPLDQHLADPATTYAVRFSTSPSLNAKGLLPVATLGKASDLETAPDGTCSTDFQTPKFAGPTALYQGTVYWQVARETNEGGDVNNPNESLKEYEEKLKKQGEEEDKELDEEERTGVAKEPQGEWEGGPVWSFHSEAKVEGASFERQRLIAAGYLTPITFTALSELEGATIELQRFAKGAWQSLSQQSYGEDGAKFFVKLPAGRQALRAVAKSDTVSLPLKPRKLMVRKIGHRLTSAEEDGRYKQKRGKKKSPEAEEETPRLPLSFAVVDGGKKVVHLRATIEGACKGPTRNSNEVPLRMKTALRSARIAPDGTVIADRKTKGTEPQQVILTGQLLDGSLIGTVETSFGNCHGSRKFEAVPVRKK
ncbi:MAG TPA: hypothetical protein VHA76_12035 [Solirubrobacterales bacterium]|nr:hypothetical protein [Solirubrobacterales bacterium]